MLVSWSKTHFWREAIRKDVMFLCIISLDEFEALGWFVPSWYEIHETRPTCFFDESYGDVKTTHKIV